MESMLCKCGNPRRSPGQRNCRECHAESMRRTRPKYKDLSPEAKAKDISRSIAQVYKGRGKLVKKPCELCGDDSAEMHHEDYNKPIEVNWLCRACHLTYHGVTA